MLVVNWPVPVTRCWRWRGFTLAELMVTVSLLAVLAALAMPYFRDFVARQRVRNASFQLVAALTQARSQAISHNVVVSLQPRNTTTDWSGGWTVTDGTHTFLVQDALAGLRISDSARLGKVSYGRDGRITTQETNFTIQDAGSSDPTAQTTRCIAIGLSGMPVSTPGACP